MADRPSKANQVRLFIRSLKPTYKTHLKFTPFYHSPAIRNIGMLIKERLSKEKHLGLEPIGRETIKTKKKRLVILNKYMP